MAHFTFTSRPVVAEVPPPPLPVRIRSIQAKTYEKLSVVIACMGQWQLTANCLDTLLRDVPDAQVIVVDNHSDDETVDYLKQREDVTVIFSPTNIGVAGGWNRGLQEAAGDVLCVLNNDTIIHPGGMQELANAAASTGISCFQGGTLDQNFQFAGYTENPAHSTYADGCCLAFRRDVWDNVGCFDEGFNRIYCEDSDWGIRARIAGYEWEILTHILTHLGQQTVKRMEDIPAHHQRNQERLRLKWAGKGVGERILVQRWAALGDVIMTTPAIASLRRQKPLARIHLQTCDRCVELMEGLPIVDSVSSEVPWEPTSIIDMNGAYEMGDKAGIWQPPVIAFANRAGVPVYGDRYIMPPTDHLKAWAQEMLCVSP